MSQQNAKPKKTKRSPTVEWETVYMPSSLGIVGIAIGLRPVLRPNRPVSESR